MGATRQKDRYGEEFYTFVFETPNSFFINLRWCNTVDFRVPSEDIEVLLKPHLEMKKKGKITVTIDLEPEWSKIVIGHSINLKTVLKAMVGS